MESLDLTPQLYLEIIENVRTSGANLSDAAQSAGVLPNVLKGWRQLASAQPDGIHAKLFREAELALAESQLEAVLHHVRAARDGDHGAKKHLSTLWGRHNVEQVCSASAAQLPSVLQRIRAESSSSRMAAEKTRARVAASKSRRNTPKKPKK